MIKAQAEKVVEELKKSIKVCYDKLLDSEMQLVEQFEVNIIEILIAAYRSSHESLKQKW